MRSLKQVLAVFLLAVLLAGMTPAAVFGADSIKLSGPNVLFVMQGASTYIDVEAKAPADTEYKLVLECADYNITMTNGKSGTMAGDGKYTMSLSVARQAEVGNYNLVLKAVDPKDSNKVLAAKNLFKKLSENRKSLLVVDWYKDEMPREKVEDAIRTSLDEDLPESYDKESFQSKITLLLNHFIDMAIQGYGWIGKVA